MVVKRQRCAKKLPVSVFRGKVKTSTGRVPQTATDDEGGEDEERSAIKRAAGQRS